MSIPDEIQRLSDIKSEAEEAAGLIRSDVCRYEQEIQSSTSERYKSLRRRDLNVRERHLREKEAEIAALESRIRALREEREEALRTASEELAEELKRSAQVERLKQLEQEAVERIRQASAALFKAYVRPIPLPYLTGDDVRLALKWSPALSRYEDAVLTGEIGSLPQEGRLLKDLGKVLSARAAERVAINFYSHHELVVEDVARSQLTGAGNEWARFDLRVDGRPVDVKNARVGGEKRDSAASNHAATRRIVSARPGGIFRPHLGAESFHFSRFMVNSFKRTLAREDVIVAGVLSEYCDVKALLGLSPAAEGRWDSYCGERRPEALFLGEITPEKHDSLIAEFNGTRQPLEVSLSPPWMPRLKLSPWLFDYPDYLYRGREYAAQELKKKIEEVPAAWDAFSRTIEVLPVCIVAGLDPAQVSAAGQLKGWEEGFFRGLWELRATRGLSLPYLFLTVLRHYLHMVREGTHQVGGFSPSAYRKFLYWGREIGTEQGGGLRHPLGLFDPLQTIDALVDALDTLNSQGAGEIVNYHSFKLVNSSILKAVDDADGRMKTVLTHCGGWKDDKPCGKAPLVIGATLGHCDEGYLICPDCDHCCGLHDNLSR